MNFGDLAFRLVLILFPGIIATLIYKRLIIRNKWEPSDYSINFILFGFFAYSVLQCTYFACGWGELVIWGRLQDNNIVEFKEVAWASIWSIGLSFLGAVFENKNWINKFGQKVGVTQKYGENTVFNDFLSNNEVSEIHIKDPNLNTIYIGYLKQYSDAMGYWEFLLQDASLYSFDDAEFYSSQKWVYLCVPKDQKLIIDVPK